MTTYRTAYFILEDEALDLNDVGRIVWRESAANWNAPDPDVRSRARMKWREFQAVRDEYERGMRMLKTQIDSDHGGDAISPAHQLWLQNLFQRLARFITPFLMASTDHGLPPSGWSARSSPRPKLNAPGSLLGTSLQTPGGAMGFGPGMGGRVGGTGIRGGRDAGQSRGRSSSPESTRERVDASSRPGPMGQMSGPSAGPGTGTGATAVGSSGPVGGANAPEPGPERTLKLVWDRSTVDDMLSLEQAQKDLEEAERQEQEKEKEQEREKDRGGGEKKEGSDKKDDKAPKTAPPNPPPKQPGPADPNIARPNPDDDGGASESVHRPNHLGLGVGPSPRRARVFNQELGAVLLRHGLDVSPRVPDEDGGPPNPYARVADADAMGGPNPPGGGPEPPKNVAPPGANPAGSDDPLLDLRLRYLMAMSGAGAGEDSVINPRALGYKPNPGDPDGPHGPNARLRGNPTVGGALRPRTGRLA